MKATLDIEPLVDIVEDAFNRRLDETHTAINNLTDLWTRLYGPNSCADDLREILNAMSDEFHSEDES
jgi:hypothetical protein